MHSGRNTTTRASLAAYGLAAIQQLPLSCVPRSLLSTMNERLVAQSGGVVQADSS